MSFFEIRNGDATFSLRNLQIAGEPDPATGTYPVCATGRIEFGLTGELREQTVYLGDVGAPDIERARAAAAAGLNEMATTIRKRMDGITPQTLLKNPTRVARRLSEVT